MVPHMIQLSKVEKAIQNTVVFSPKDLSPGDVLLPQGYMGNFVSSHSGLPILYETEVPSPLPTLLLVIEVVSRSNGALVPIVSYGGGVFALSMHRCTLKMI